MGNVKIELKGVGEQKEKRMKKQEKKTGLKEILKGGQETLPGFQFHIYRAEDKRSLWNADFEILFLRKGDGESVMKTVLCIGFKRRIFLL